MAIEDRRQAAAASRRFRAAATGREPRQRPRGVGFGMLRHMLKGLVDPRRRRRRLALPRGMANLDAEHPLHRKTRHFERYLE